MTSTTLPRGTTPTSASEQIDSSVTTVLTAADATSADRIQTLSLITQARVSRLTRAVASATAQYGANSAQATTAQIAMTAGLATVGRLQILHRQVTTAAPQVAPAGWVLHGRVYDAQLQPVSGYTVFLVDSQKTYQEAYGFAYTDSTGYFLINFAGITSPPSDANAGASSENPAPQALAAAPAETFTDQLFVEIANTTARPVYLSASPFQPSFGNASYQNITLPTGDPVLGDPPEAIRKVAIPPQRL